MFSGTGTVKEKTKLICTKVEKQQRHSVSRKAAKRAKNGKDKSLKQVLV
jgi:hypothetical protein